MKKILDIPSVLQSLGVDKNFQNDAKTLARRAPGPLSVYVDQSELAKREEDQDSVIKKVSDPSLGTPFSKSILNLLDGGGHSIERLAFDRDPTRSYEYASIFRPKMYLTPDALLKRVAIQDDLLAAILQIRSNHVARMGLPAESRFDMGFKIEPKLGVVDKFTDEQTAELKKRIAEATTKILTCGSTENVDMLDRCSFREYLHKSTRNGLIVGRFATEFTYAMNKDGEEVFHSFRPVDAGTIFFASSFKEAAQAVRDEALSLLETLRNKKLEPERFKRDEYAWIQVIEGRPFQAFSEKELVVHNLYPVTDWELGGYPLTPIDTILGAVTTHINIGNHNKAYFQSGRASRGMLVVKSADINLKIVESMRQQFNAAINGVQNCVAGDTQIITDKGATTYEKFLNGAETRMTRLWTGTDWCEAMIYRVEEPKELCSFTLNNGVSIQTSPDHKFYVIGSDGTPSWKAQKELQIGDFVAVNKHDAANSDLVPEIGGRKLTENMMEVLGWMTGDGAFSSKGFQLFYHHAKEREIWARHQQILTDFGLPAQAISREVTEEEKEYLKDRYGFKSIASERLSIQVNNSAFARTLIASGFTYSSRGPEGKTIPDFMYALPTKLKGAFLRGLFSADGNNKKGLDPEITITNDRLRGQVKSLLLSMGIRTCLSEGKNKLVIKGRERSYKLAKHKLAIKDRAAFFEKIGFLQDHKQPIAPKGTNKGWGVNTHIPQQTVLKYLRIVKDKTKLPRGGNDHNVGLPRVFTKRQQCDIDEILRGERAATLSRLLNYMTVAKVDVPSWMLDYHYESIVSIDRTGTLVQMYDSTVYDKGHGCTGASCKSDKHSLVTNGVYTRQSWRMPVFGCGPEDEITWQPIDTSGSRDMEFQYLTDNNARTILAAYQLSPEEVPGFQHLARGTNSQALCLHPASKIFTPNGYITLGSLLGDVAQEQNTLVWTGTGWAEAKVFRTGKKIEATTRLGNGLNLKTSPDHRFRVIGDEGVPVWKTQKELQIGDSVLVNKRPVSGKMQSPSFRGKPLTVEMMEVLGWLTGDGNISVRKKQIALSWFYHHEKEQDIWQKHFSILRDWGLAAKHEKREVSDDEARKMMEYKGVKHVAPYRITNRLYDTEFSKWLLSLGFTASSRKEGEGKTIPAFVHVLPDKFKEAFLRGFFSADGTLDKNTGAIRIVIHDDRLREQTKHLLMGLGIRTQGSEGKSILSWGRAGEERTSNAGQSVLCIKDKNVFFERVGFLQAHKQPTPKMLAKRAIWERAARQTQIHFVNRILESGVKLPDRDRNNLLTILNPNIDRHISVPNLRHYMQQCNIEIPSWFDDYYFEPVVALETSDQEIEMVDVSVFNDDHSFVANGMVVHNSESSGEYKLEAARDVGIRPLMTQFEQFINDYIFPLIDKRLSEICRIKFVGLDADTPEKESTRLQEDMSIHMTYSEILEKVEKDPIPKQYGGDFPLNTSFIVNIEKYLTFGEILEYYFGKQGASQQPELKFYQNPFWLQMQKLISQQQQVQQQNQLALQQPQSQGGSEGSEKSDGAEKTDAEGSQAPQGEDVAAALDQLIAIMGQPPALNKGEEQLSPNKRKLKAQLRMTNKYILDSWEKESKDTIDKIVDLAEAHKPKGK